MRVWVGLRLAHARCLLLEAQDRLQTYGVLSRHDVRQHLHELLTNPLCARPTPANGPQKPALESCAAVLQCEVRSVPSPWWCAWQRRAVWRAYGGMGGWSIRPIDRTRTETPGLEGLLGREEGAEHRPGRHSRHQRGATDPMVATVNENTDRSYALHES